MKVTKLNRTPQDIEMHEQQVREYWMFAELYPNAHEFYERKANIWLDALLSFL